MSTLTATPSTRRDDAAVHAARYVADAALLGAPDFQVTAWLSASGDLSARSAGYLAATLADRNVRDALLLAAVGADGAVVEAVANGDGPADAVGAVIANPRTSTATARVRAVLDAVAEQAEDAPTLAAEALAASAALAWLSGDARRAVDAAHGALTLATGHRLAGLVLRAAILLPTPRAAAAADDAAANADQAASADREHATSATR